MRLIEEPLVHGESKIQGLLHTPSLELPTLLVRPAVLIIPGGGYQYNSEKDGAPVALAYVSHGMHAFHMTYAPDPEDALQDALYAFSLLRENAVDWGIDSSQIAIMGTGSGANLAARLVHAALQRPSALVLSNPDFSFGHTIPDADTPPTFLYSEGHRDALVYAQALCDANIPYEMHICTDNPHALSTSFLQKLWSGKGVVTHAKVIDYSVDTTLQELMQDERCAAIFYRHFGGMKKMLNANAAIVGMTPRQLAGYSRGMISDEVLDQMNADLSALKKAVSFATKKQNAVFPGKVWLDTSGKRIQAHGGAVWYEDGVYYWYGENKEDTDGKNGIWTSGIRCYTSKDLYNWQDEGLIIPPSDNPASNLYPTRRVDRPHIVKSDATGRYVCWIKLSGAEACFAILSAESMLGNWRIEKENYYPGGHKVGDFDIIKDEQTGKHYLYSDIDHEAIACYALSEDCLTAEAEVSRSYEGLHAPFCREGVALFEHEGNKYMLTSGMTGYIPNRSDSAVSKDWCEPFVPIGDPHVDDASHASFNSQITKVFKVAGSKDLYIAMADRWVPEYVVDAKRADAITRVIASRYDPARYPATDEERRETVNSPMLISANTSIADYVWLPIRFTDGKPTISWHDEWRVEDYL